MNKLTKEKLIADKNIAQLLSYLDAEFGIARTSKNPKIASVFVFGSKISGESLAEDDFDIEIVFYDQRHITDSNLSKIRAFAKGFEKKLDIFVEHINDYGDGTFKASANNRFASKTLLFREVATGVTIAGENVLDKINLTRIPEEEQYGYLNTAFSYFYDKKYAKAILVAAQALELTELKLNDFKTYNAIVLRLKNKLQSNLQKILETAYLAKIGKSAITELEAEKFLKFVGGKIISYT